MMRRFILNTTIFIGLFILFALLLNLGTDLVLKDKKYFTVDQSKEYVIMGHSHAACAYNDTLLNNFQNLANAMEGYFYTYYKAKKLIKSNRNIKGIFIEFTNNQITVWANDRIWGKYLGNQLPKYATVIDARGILMLLKKAPLKTMETLNVSLWKKLKFLVGEEKSFVKEESWGGYKTGNTFYAKEKVDSLSRSRYKPGALLKLNYSVSDVNINYLSKTVKLCKDNNVKVYLIRSPVPSYTRITNEGTLNDILKNEFADVPFIDFKNFKLTNEDFADEQHLNYSGSKKLSLFFNDLIKKGALEKPNVREFVEEQINLQNNLE